MADRIESDVTLTPGQSIVSGNGRYKFEFQGDGNLVLYHKLGFPLWASHTQGQPANRLVMQNDGNLVIYTPDSPIWATQTDGNGPSHLVMQNDGNVVIYRNDGTRATWATGTSNPGVPIPAPVRDALGGLIEGKVRESLANREFAGDHSKTHKIRVLGAVVGSYTEEASVTGRVQDPFDLDITQLLFFPDSLDLQLDLALTAEIHGTAKGKLKNVASISTNFTAQINLSASMLLDVDVANARWGASVRDLSAAVSRLKISNDALNAFSGDIQSKINHNIDIDDIKRRLNTALDQFSGDASLPEWLGQVSAYL